MARTLCWFSSGAASAVATKIMLKEDPSALVVQCDMRGSEDEDNARFSDECGDWFGASITYIRSREYRTIDDIFEKRKYHAGIHGAPCTGELKFAPRLDFQLPSDTHIWGYTADKSDARRWDRMRETYPDMKQRAPLIERGITKAECLGIIERAGIKPPRVYEMGFPNANCVGCVKATSPRYWSLVREQFPEVFARRAEQSRRFGSKLTRLPGEGWKRFSLDELPDDMPTSEAEAPQCDFLCTAIADEIAS